MKKLIVSILMLTFFFTTSNAQFDTDKLFGGANLAFAKPVGDFSDFAKGGFSYNVLAGYQLTEKLGVGIEYGNAVTGGIDTTGGGIFGLSAFGLQSFLAKGWYRFSTGNVRPYVGVGIGGAQVTEPDITFTDATTNEEVTVEGASRIGLGANVEVGLNIKGFNLSYSYNLSGKGPKEPVFSEGIKDLNIGYHRFAAGYVYNF